MSDVNDIVLTGRFVRDPENRSFNNSDLKIVNFTIANNRGWGDNKKANFFRCTVFGNFGDVILKYCKKGTEITFLRGELTETTTETEGGQKRNWVSIIVKELKFRNKDKIGHSTEEIPEPDWTSEKLQDMFGG